MSTIADAERYAHQLNGTVLFRDVPEDRIRKWLYQSNVSIAEYDGGEYLYQKTDTTNRIGIMLRGSAEVNRKSRDGLMHMSVLKRNDLFGAASICGEDASFVTDIRARERTRVLIIPEEEMLNLLSDNRTVLKNYLSYLNGRIRFLNRRLDAFSKNTVAGRIMTLFTAESTGGVYTANSYTKLSESLCISRATLYRALDTLEKEHKIRRNGKVIELLEEYEP
ncbi:MAG: Crp/Fnr family transcriptional regulator [Clostridia bacterium]|nr:Crp/Fnr family transcriptional regulator [Clostridia bacterium]